MMATTVVICMMRTVFSNVIHFFGVIVSVCVYSCRSFSYISIALIMTLLVYSLSLLLLLVLRI